MKTSVLPVVTAARSVNGGPLDRQGFTMSILHQCISMLEVDRSTGKIGSTGICLCHVGGDVFEREILSQAEVESGEMKFAPFQDGKSFAVYVEKNGGGSAVCTALFIGTREVQKPDSDGKPSVPFVDPAAPLFNRFFERPAYAPEVGAPTPRALRNQRRTIN